MALLGETVSNLKSDIERMTKFLQDLRTLARAYRLNITSFDLFPIVHDVLQSVGPLCQRNGITVIDELRSSSPLVYADSERCREILQHLITNAIEAMPNGGALTIRAMPVEKKLQISIHDTGPGVPHNLDIFAPFITTKPGGTGLGLTISLQLVVSQQGNLTFQSVPDHGTTFVLELPRPADMSAHEESVDSIHADASQRKQRAYARFS
jgi:signal transduction histidine kinase